VDEISLPAVDEWWCDGSAFRVGEGSSSVVVDESSSLCPLGRFTVVGEASFSTCRTGARV
jgi:hypothetical protein